MLQFMQFIQDQVKPEVDQVIEQVILEKFDDRDLTKLLVRGKRLRAGIIMAMQHAWGGDEKAALRLAAAVELAHSASLICDDMIDSDDTRRGQPARHITVGHKQAMLDTIGVISLPYELVAPYGEIYVRALAKTQQSMVRGVIHEVIKNPGLPASALYDAIIAQKTGKLFQLAAIYGYSNTGRGKHIKEIAAWGLHVGKAMQIADDIADLRVAATGASQSKPGSEMVLLRCVTAEQLARELITDVKGGSLHPGRVKELWEQEGVQKSLQQVLDKQINAADAMMAAIDETGIARYVQILRDIPHEIPIVMMNEV